MIENNKQDGNMDYRHIGPNTRWRPTSAKRAIEVMSEGGVARDKKTRTLFRIASSEIQRLLGEKWVTDETSPVFLMSFDWEIVAGEECAPCKFSTENGLWCQFVELRKPAWAKTVYITEIDSKKMNPRECGRYEPRE